MPLVSGGRNTADQAPRRGDTTPRNGTPTWLVGACVAIAYAAGSWISYEMFHASSAGAVLFPPAGVSFAALALSRRHRWPALLCVIASTELLVDLAQGQRIQIVVGFILANTLEPLLGAFLFSRFFSGRIDRRKDLLGFITTGAIAGPFLGALVGATTISLGFHKGWFGSFLPFWSGDGLGVLTVGGAILAWKANPPRDLRRTAAVVATASSATMVVTAVGFWPASVPFMYLPIPLLIFLAFRYGPVVVTTAGLVMALTANVMSAAGHGPWGLVGPTARLGIVTLQTFLIVAILAAWLLAVEAAEQRAAREDHQRESAARRVAEAIQTLTAHLATATSSAAVCRAVIDHGIGLVAKRGVVGLLSVDGTELLSYVTDDFPKGVAAKYQRLPIGAATQITQAARLGQIEIAQTLQDLERDFPHTLDTYVLTNTRSSISVPARSGSRIVGALTFGFDNEDDCNSDALAVAKMLGDLFGQAVDRAQKYEHEFDTAHQLQRALLPVIAPNVRGINIVTRYQPAEMAHEVGGDWYDVFELANGRIGFAVGDVVGHDLDAAIAMFRLQTFLRVIASGAAGPSAVLEHLSSLALTIPGAQMTTIGYGDYDPVTRMLRYSSAGHMPFLLRAQSTDYLWGGRSAPLGIKGQSRSQAELTVPAGSLILGFTDGLVERRQEPISDGFERLATFVQDLDIANLDGLCDSVLAHMLPSNAEDDTAILCLHFP
jgi:serine phosphatase RsbU (regulator of sigma subunit)/integral membrane sensor domain MASE1